jgi:hypothetical protein
VNTCGYWSLLRLKAFFARQWQQMPAAQFMAVFGPYAARIGQVLDRYPRSCWPPSPPRSATTTVSFRCAPRS